MANRYYGYDIITKLEAIANDQDEGINAVIDIINAERSLNPPVSCPHVLKILTGPTQRMFPEMYIDVTSSTVDIGDDTIGGGGTILGTSLGSRYPDKTPESYDVEISIMHKSNYEGLALWVEIYAEAIYRTFHNYCDSNITWILATSSIRNDIQTDRRETAKMAGYIFNLKITQD